MKTKATRIALMLFAVLTAASVGCTSRGQEASPALRVGIVYLDRILPQLKEYQEFSDQYVQDRMRLLKDFGTDPKRVEQMLKDDTRRQEVEQSIQKWDQTRRKFLDRLSDEVRTASVTVAKDKQIDVVLQSAPWLPVNERMAVDITTDVMFALNEARKAGGR